MNSFLTGFRIDAKAFATHAGRKRVTEADLKIARTFKNLLMGSAKCKWLLIFIMFELISDSRLLSQLPSEYNSMSRESIGSEFRITGNWRKDYEVRVKDNKQNHDVVN
jgi:hypothetical protein